MSVKLVCSLCKSYFSFRCEHNSEEAGKEILEKLQSSQYVGYYWADKKIVAGVLEKSAAK